MVNKQLRANPKDIPPAWRLVLRINNLLPYHISYCDGLLKALTYGSRKLRVTRSTIELRLLSSEALNNDDNRKTIEDVS